MSAATVTLKTGDRLPSLELILEQLVSGAWTPYDLTGSTVRFRMRNSAGTTVIDADATVVDAVAGVVRYEWGATDTTVAGDYQATMTATASGKPRTFPNEGFLTIRIETAIPPPP